MKNLILSILTACVLFVAVPMQAQETPTNAELFQQIQTDTTELQALLKIVSDGEIDYGWGFTIPLPAAVRSTMVTRMLALKINIKTNLNALTVE